MKYYFKALLSDRRSGYDSAYQYKMGINTHPYPDLSDTECGRGLHMAKNIRAALSYVPDAEEVYLVSPGKILGNGSDKVRSDRCTLLFRIPQSMLDDYFARRKLLDDDYCARRKLLNDDYFARRKLLNDDYFARRKLLNSNFKRKVVRAFNKEVQHERARATIGHLVVRQSGNDLKDIEKKVRSIVSPSYMGRKKVRVEEIKR